jgi:hypothetical protein
MSLVSSDENLSKFLILLEHDLPDQICVSCQRLHKIENAQRYIRTSDQPWPVPVPNCMARAESCRMRLKYFDLIDSNMQLWLRYAKHRAMKFQG